MDEFRIWNYARSEAEIQATKDLEINSTYPGLISYYNFNEGIACCDNTGLTTLPDGMGAHNGTLHNFALNGGCTSNWRGGVPVLGDSLWLVNDLTNDCSDPSGVFSVGTHTVTWTATGANNATATCAQTVTVLSAPGGVGDELTLWLKADAGVTTSGSDVTLWADQAAGGKDVTPLSTSPVLNGSDVNFNPGIDFTNDILTTSTNGIILPNTSYTKVAVFKFDGAGTNNIISSSVDNATAFWGSGSTTNLHLWHNLNNFVTANNVVNTSRYYLGTGVYGQPSGQINQVRVDGNLKASNTNSIAFGTDALVRIGGHVAGNFLNGRIAEAIVFNRDLTASELQKVESYLSLKYGITLDQTAAQNYLASDGSTLMWDASTTGSYKHDIAGIGRDDCSTLDQRQSRSVNSDAIVTMGLGAIAASNAANANAFGANQQFLVWANNDAAPAKANSTTNNLPSGVNERMTRVWQVEENNGDVGTLEIQLNLSSLGWTPTSAGDYFLLIDDDGSDFSNATKIAASSFSSDIATFTGVNLADGQYFTLGVSSCDISITSFTVMDEVCPGANDGQITVVAVCNSCGSSLDIRYSISPDPNSVGLQTSNVFSNLPDDTYTITVEDVNDPTCTDSGLQTINPGVDITAPTVTCPTPDPVANTSDDGTGDCSTVISGLQATGADNCTVAGNLEFTYSVTGATTQASTNATGSPLDLSGIAFNTGLSTVNVSVTDEASNTSTTCSFTVTVNDDEKPSITCPSNIVQSTDAGVCTADVTVPQPTVDDNCPVETPVATTNTITIEAWIYPEEYREMQTESFSPEMGGPQ
ncbi:MAG: hypothetical protein IPJ40_02505 [Saprospirales bacterium]|nr:hypothetical protein [Saprospirales bacterium]